MLGRFLRPNHNVGQLFGPRIFLNAYCKVPNYIFHKIKFKIPTSASSNIVPSSDQNPNEASARNVAKVNFSELDRIAELAEADDVSPPA
jgi:hypothetical protein